MIIVIRFDIIFLTSQEFTLFTLFVVLYFFLVSFRAMKGRESRS